MKCPHCGFSNSDYSYRCVKCGRDLTNASQYKAPPSPPPPQQQQPPRQKPPQNPYGQQNRYSSNQNKWSNQNQKTTRSYTHTKTTYTSNQNKSGFQSLFQKNTNTIETYLIPNIIATLMCCMPLGLVGLFYSTHVQHQLDAGNLDAAKEASQKAYSFMVIAYISGFLFGVIYIIGQLIAIFGVQ